VSLFTSRTASQRSAAAQHQLHPTAINLPPVCLLQKGKEKGGRTAKGYASTAVAVKPRRLLEAKQTATAGGHVRGRGEDGSQVLAPAQAGGGGGAASSPIVSARGDAEPPGTLGDAEQGQEAEPGA
jgi:hypothetical protein